MQVTFKQFWAIWFLMNKDKLGLSPAPFHKEVFDFLLDYENWQNGTGVLQVFRNGAKSTIVTLFITYLLVEDPRRLILVQSADDRTAHKVLRGVQDLIRTHPLAVHLAQKSREWKVGSFFVEGAADPANPSVSGYGIRSNITGRRAHWIIYDDVEAKGNANTDDKRTEIRNRVSEGMNIMQENGKRLFVGTPHAYDTLYDEVISRGASSLSIPMLRNAKGVWPTMTGDCVWPERFNEEEVRRKQETVPKHEWMSQNMLVPWNMHETILEPNLLERYEDDAEYYEANGEGMLRIGDKRMAGASAFWDVSSGRSGRDRSVLAVVYTDGDGHYYIHRTERLEGDIDVQVQAIKAIALELMLPAVSVETNGVGVHAVHILRKALKGTGIATLEVHQVVNKKIRIIEAFQAALSGHYIHAHKKVLSSPLKLEMKEFSMTNTRGHDDYLDAVASAILKEPIRINSGGSTRFKRKNQWGAAALADNVNTGKYDPFTKKTA